MKEIYFTGGKTPPEAFPYMELIEASEKALKKLKGAFAYYPVQHEYADYSLKGYRELREVAVKRYKDREKIDLSTENIVITTGSMQAVELISRAFINPGDIVITEELSYYGSLKLFRYLKARIVGVELDEETGMNIDALEDILKTIDRLGDKPSFIYTMSNNQNPTGARMPEKNRRRLLNLAKEYGIKIVEDDCYGDLDFTLGEKPRALLTLDEDKDIIYIGSFSKIVAPGIRLGYFYSPEKYIDDILKHRWDIGTSLLSSAILAEYLKDKLWDQIWMQVDVIKRKRDAVLNALDENLSGFASWTRPDGGLFIWVKLNKEIDMNKLISKAAEKGVYFDPGKMFHYRMRDIRAFRLSYAHVPLEDIFYGIEKLSEAVKELLE